MAVTRDISDDLGKGNLLAGFFKALWSRPANTQALEVNIPHTVVFRFTKPVEWYFTSKQQNSVKKKTKKRLYMQQVSQEMGKSHLTNNNNNNNNTPVAFYQSLSTRGIETLWLNNERDVCTFRLGISNGEGILQQHIISKKNLGRPAVNSVYQVTLCCGRVTIEHTTNRHLAEDQSTSISDRYDDGKALISTVVPNNSRKNISAVVERISNHLSALYCCKVSNLVLRCKIDRFNTIWVLSCSALRAVSQDGTAVCISLTGIRKSTQKERRAVLLPSSEELECRLCQKVKHKSEMGTVKRKVALFSLHVLEHFSSAETANIDFNEKLLWGHQPQDAVPRCISVLYPDMTPSEFSLIKGTSWMEGCVNCCYDCITQLIYVTSSIKVDTDGGITKPFAARPLPAIANPPRLPSPCPTPAASVRPVSEFSQGISSEAYSRAL